MADGNDADCPSCGARTDTDRWCGVCGIDLQGADANLLRDLARQLAATEIELNAIWARRDALAADLMRRRWQGVPGAAPAAPPEPAEADVFLPRSFERAPRPARSPRGEIDVDRVRNVLLWLGATLLALSALAFTAVAWTHLGPGGRALLLVAITVVSTVLASGTRRRLPATSGAFTGLTIALALIDWQVARRAGVASGLSTATWWAIGTAVVGVLSFGLGRIAAATPARRAIALLLPASAVLAVAVAAGAAWSAGLGLGLIAAALAVADGALSARRARHPDPVVNATLRVTAGVLWAVGATFAVAAAFEPGSFVQTLAPAGVMVALAGAPAIVLFRSRRAPERGPEAATREPMAVAVLAALTGALLTSASTSVGPIGLLTFGAMVGAVLFAAAPFLSEVWKRAAQVVGVIAAGAGFVFAITAAALSELGPLAWLDHAWAGNTGRLAVRVVAGPKTNKPFGLGWCAVAILVAAAAEVAIAAHPRSRVARVMKPHEWLAVAVGLALLAIDLAPVAAGATALVACAVTTAAFSLAMVGAAIVARRAPERASLVGCLALVPALPAAGWAALTPGASITVLAVAIVAALVAAVMGAAAVLRAAHIAFAAAATIGLAAVVAVASGGSQPHAALAATIVAGVVLLAGSLARRDRVDGPPLEVVGAAGMASGVLLASVSIAWLAGTLTATVPFLVIASARRERTLVYASTAGAAALAATWAWLAAVNVTVVEAYTLPAAVLALAAGAWAWKTGRARSWLNLGPALVLTLAPTLLLAIARNDDGRAIAVGLGACAILLFGAWRQLQAPLVLGTITLLALGVDKLGPSAVRLPRWAMLAAAGALLLWVGTTFERRRDDVQRAARRLAELG